MSSLVSGVTSLVRTLNPYHGARWSDSRIERAIHLADLAICEGAEVVWDSHEIELDDGELYYSIPDEIVSVRSVEYSYDGVNYEAVLTPCTIADLDRRSSTWPDDTGSSPDCYVLPSITGSSAYSQIILWRPIASTTGEKIRINYVKCRPEVGDLAGVSIPDDIQQTVYLPYVLAMLHADDDADTARMYMAEYYRGLEKVRVRYDHRTQERTEDLREVF